ncbi:MAG: NAD(P)/FAD-dependent oxidoreductase [Gaiellales bacterium]
MKAIVVGGGVVGTACAYQLLGVADEVVLIDAGGVGLGATAGNAGWVTPTLGMPLASPGILTQGLRSAFDRDGALIIRPSLDPQWARWLWRFARKSRQVEFERGMAALMAITLRSLDALDAMRADGVEFEEHKAGLLVTAFDREGVHWFDATFDALRNLGFPGGMTPMSGDEARALEPALGPRIGYAVRTEVDRHVDPTGLVNGLAEVVRQRGGTVIEHAPAKAIRRISGGYAVDGPQGEIARGDVVVLSSALGTPELIRPYGLRLPMVGAKGYSVTVSQPTPAPTLPLYLCECKLGTSSIAGGLRIAGFFELGSDDPAASPARADQLLRETQEYLAGPLDPTPVEGSAGWAGFRPATPDSLPLLGPVPGAPGLFLATGHGMLGVTLAPATGVAIAALVRGERPAWIAPFAPDR